LSKHSGFFVSAKNVFRLLQKITRATPDRSHFYIKAGFYLARIPL